MSTAKPRQLPMGRIDERLTNPNGDVAALAAALGLPVAQTAADPRAAGITDVTAYLATAEHVRHLTVLPVQRCANDRAAR